MSELNFYNNVPFFDRIVKDTCWTPPSTFYSLHRATMEGVIIAWTILAVSLCICPSDSYDRHDVTFSRRPPRRVLRGRRDSSSSLECVLKLEKGVADCSMRQLEKVPDDLAKNINTLDLSFNEIPALLNNAFRTYTSLTKLLLTTNRLVNIESEVFYPLVRLKEIDLSHNYLKLHTGSIFQFCKHLSYIDLHSCGINYIPDDFLKWLPRLDFLDLSSNKLNRLKLSCTSNGTIGILKIGDHGQVAMFTSEFVNLSCKIDEMYFGYKVIIVDPDTVATLRVRKLTFYWVYLLPKMWLKFFNGITRSNIESLDLGRSNLGKNALTFINLQDKHLTTVDFSSSKIENRMYQSVFSSLNMVSHLILEYNLIERIEPEYFTGMDALKSLHLHGNKIATINQEPYSNWTIDVYEIDLSRNRLREIHPFSFYGLQNLTVLNLYANYLLETLNITSFSLLRNLKYLNVSRTGLTNLGLFAPLLKSFLCYGLASSKRSPINDAITFKHTPLLEYIDLQNSELASIDFYFSQSLFKGLRKLRTLKLSNNGKLDNWNILSKSLFEDTLLSELFLSNCGIGKSSLSGATFNGLVQLSFLDLSNNNLLTLPRDVFQTVINLQTLDLSSNSLVSFDEMAFSNLSLLKELYLGKNKLMYLSHAAFRCIQPSLRWIDLSNNPIVCSCDMTWLLSWLETSLSLVNEKQTVCSLASIDSLKGKHLTAFNAEVCQVNRYIILYCGIPIFVFAAALTVVIIHHNRWWFRFKFFLLKLAIFGFREIQDARDHRDFEFDLNIMFIDNDEEWVRDHLRPFLEERLPDFDRVVFGDDDLILGMHILDAVDFIVQRSYKTVVLFSRRAVLDNWFLIKFRTAMDHVADVEMENLVVIFLEDIPDEELPFLLRLYLSDRRPHLLWMEDEEGQEYFWKELLKDLTINLRRNNLIPPE